MTSDAKILIIDDELSIQKYLAMLLKSEGYDAAVAGSLVGGVARCEEEEFDVVLLDINLPDGSGLDALPRIQDSVGQPEVIIITGQGDPDGAELAIRNGAWDYIEKPFLNDAIKLPISRALLYHNEKRSIAKMQTFNREEIIGSSAAICKSILYASRAANSGFNTLLSGETGTGKELFARAIHQNSSRSDKSFIPVDCAALPENLVESTLFGHVKGAYTGAEQGSDGLIKLAHQGTLFLDEIGELSLSAQKSLLRVLQEKKFRPVGGSREIESDFCLISATNRNLDTLVQQGRFRQDLLFRLRAIHIELPPLRSRNGDVDMIVSHIVDAYCLAHKMPQKTISDELSAALHAYDWPGNVRELHGVLNYVLSAAGTRTVLYPEYLPVDIRAKIVKGSIRPKERELPTSEPWQLESPASDWTPESYKSYRENIFLLAERPYLVNLMDSTGWDMAQACVISGLSRSRLYALLKRHEITRSSS